MEILVSNIIVSVFEAFIIFFVIRQKKLASKIYCLLIFIQCFILHAFLDPYKMVDLPNYISTFKLFSSNTLSHSILIGYVGVKMEIGWIILCKALSYLWNNYQILLIFISLVIVGCYCLTIYRFSPVVWLSVFIYLCTMYDQSLYVLRQHTAMALCLLSISFFINHQYKKTFIIYLLAFSIHSTAVVFGLAYLLSIFKYNKTFWIYLLIITFTISLISGLLFNWLFSSTWYNSYSEKEGANYTGFLMALCTLILYLYSVKGNTQSIPNIEKVFLAMTILGVSMSFIGVGFSPTNRLVKYFTTSAIFLIPISISKIGEPVERLIITLVIMVFYLMLFFSPSNLLYIEGYRLIL